MAVTRLLFNLQELDTEIERQDSLLHVKQGQLGNRDVLDKAQVELDAAQKQFDELKHKHRDAEAEVTDILGKIAEIEGQLYSGKITNPKELSGLQHESNMLKAHSDELEDNTLAIIDQVETAEKSAATGADDLKRLEAEWQQLQQQLTSDIKQLIASLEDLRNQRQELVARIDASAVDLYEKIRKQKSPAVARVEQGICRACRISLSASALQRARSGQPIQCGTCGRILYIS